MKKEGRIAGIVADILKRKFGVETYNDKPFDIYNLFFHIRGIRFCIGVRHHVTDDHGYAHGIIRFYSERMRSRTEMMKSLADFQDKIWEEIELIDFLLELDKETTRFIESCTSKLNVEIMDTNKKKGKTVKFGIGGDGIGCAVIDLHFKRKKMTE